MCVNKKAPLSILLIILFSIFQYGCDAEKEQQALGYSQPDSEDPLIFIVHPYDNPSTLVARFTPLCEYLGKHIGIPVRLVIARSYVDQIKRISNADADLAYMGPSPFIRAQDHYLKGKNNKLIPIAAEVTGGSASYHSVIVVRNDSKIMTIKDMADRTLALGSPHSFSSHYVPKVMLGNEGILFSNLRDFSFLGRHERVALSVLHGDFDAGGLNINVALRYKDRNPGLKILAKSPPLPPHLLVARPGLDEETLDKLMQAIHISPQQSIEYTTSLKAIGDDVRFSKPDMGSFETARRITAAVESIPVNLKQW